MKKRNKNRSQPAIQASKKLRGFAAMTAEQRRRIASMGGKAAQQSGKAHRWNEYEAREYGAKGGKASQGGVTRFDSESGAKAARKRKRG